MARQKFDCVRSCIPAGTGANAVAATTNRKLVKITAGGVFDYGEPAVELTSAAADKPYGVQYNYDDGAGRVGIAINGLVIVEKAAATEAADVGKEIKPTATANEEGLVDTVATGGFGVVVAIEGGSSKLMLVDLSIPA